MAHNPACKAKGTDLGRSMIIVILITVIITGFVLFSFDNSETPQPYTEVEKELKTIEVSLAEGEKKRFRVFRTFEDGTTEKLIFSPNVSGTNENSYIQFSIHGKYGEKGDHLLGSDEFNPYNKNYSFTGSRVTNRDIHYVDIWNKGKGSIKFTLVLYGKNRGVVENGVYTEMKSDL